MIKKRVILFLLLIFYFIKYGLLKKKPYIINYKPSYFDKIIFKLIRSNHPNRFYAIYNENIKSDAKYKSAGFYQNSWNGYNNLFENLIFCGDSHSEFFSRIKYDDKNILCIWYGHTSLLTTYFDKSYLNHFNLIQYYLNIFPSNKKNKFIFSIGDTDIRFIFYKSLKLKTFKNIDDLLIKYTEILDDYIKYLKTNINKFYSNSEIFFLEILLNDSHGYVTDNIDDLKILIKHNNFVLLGSKNDYFNWTNYVNDIVKEACNKHNITFIKTNYVVNNNNNNLLVNNGLSFDGVHIANLDYLNKMFNQLQ